MADFIFINSPNSSISQSSLATGNLLCCIGGSVLDRHDAKSGQHHRQSEVLPSNAHVGNRHDQRRDDVSSGPGGSGTAKGCWGRWCWIGWMPNRCQRGLNPQIFVNVLSTEWTLSTSWIPEIPCSELVGGAFQPPWVIWVIRLTSPHLP